jgi:4'-phosphopantetheinyl transferase EntD
MSRCIENVFIQSGDRQAAAIGERRVSRVAHSFTHGRDSVIEDILPDAVVVEEAREDSTDVVLFPQEDIALGQAVEKRRREFTTARACAHRALVRLNLPPQPISVGGRGEPRWPVGLVGSITHCHGYRACALAHAADIVTIGIDAEPNERLPAGVLAAIARDEELLWLRERMATTPAVSWDRLLFSAKESVYKACSPFAQRRLGFEDAMVTVDPGDGDPGGRPAAACAAGAFCAHLLVPGLRLAGGSLSALQGRWLACDDLLLTAVAPLSPKFPL